MSDDSIENDVIVHDIKDKSKLIRGRIYLVKGIEKIWDGKQWRKVCYAPGCRRYAVLTDYCKAHGGGRRCEFSKIENNVRVGCDKSAADGTPFCKSHGGGRRCTYTNCTKSAVGKTSLCKAHGGGKRCAFIDCPKSAVSPTDFCIAHGGGKRCGHVTIIGIDDAGKEITKKCSKSARGSTGFCIGHGGGKRCKVKSCNRVPMVSSDHCSQHRNLPTDESYNPKRRKLSPMSNATTLSKSPEKRNIIHRNTNVAHTTSYMLTNTLDVGSNNTTSTCSPELHFAESPLFQQQLSSVPSVPVMISHETPSSPGVVMESSSKRTLLRSSSSEESVPLHAFPQVNYPLIIPSSARYVTHNVSGKIIPINTAMPSNIINPVQVQNPLLQQVLVNHSQIHQQAYLANSMPIISQPGQSYHTTMVPNWQQEVLVPSMPLDCARDLQTSKQI